MVKEVVTEIDSAQERKLKNFTLAVYIMQAAAFLLGFTYIVGVVTNYVKKDEVAGHWLESHFRWQIRTFWFSLLWMAVGIVTVFIYIGGLIIIADGVWIIYRIAKGWIRLMDEKPMYEK